MNLESVKNVFFIGVGGIGMSALARYFHAMKYEVSGYDKTETRLTKELQKEGVKVGFEDLISNIDDDFLDKSNTLVVYTPAIPEDNALLNYFMSQGYEMKKRSQVLGMLTKSYKGICVAGTHGKTTISTMTAHLLKQSKIDCSAFLGGISQNYKTNLLLSDKSPYVVLEADEYDRSFLHLSPYLAFISSMDADHLDIYGSRECFKESFQDFSDLVKSGGSLLVNYKIKDEFSVKNTVKKYSYALDNELADFYGCNIKLIKGEYHFDMSTPDGIFKDFHIKIPGLLNVENAIGALALANMSGVEYEELQKSLVNFKGIRRRFDYKVKTDDLVLIDDYAHHPAEINATVDSVRKLYPDKKITGIFQPHLYSRTNDFYKEFAESLNELDELILLDIYPARELPIEGVSSKMILDLVNLKIKQISSKQDLFVNLQKLKPEVVLAMGAGDIDKEIQLLTKKINNK